MRIELLGTSFTIQTDEDPEYLSDIVDYFKTKIQEIQSGVSTRDPLKISILSSIVVIDELFKERARAGTPSTAEEGEEAQKIAQDLIHTLEQSLGEAATNRQQPPPPAPSSDEE